TFVDGSWQFTPSAQGKILKKRSWTSFTCKCAYLDWFCNLMDRVKMEVEEFDLLSVKSETEMCKFLYHDKKEDLAENFSGDTKKLSLTGIILNCLSQCRQISYIICDSECQPAPRLVECPYCLWECKNFPDRLLQLLDHAKNSHNVSMDTIAQLVLEKYQPLMHYMMNEYLKLLRDP
ncbi:Transcriptional repressor NF-X1, partial [Frankliniella fusca]